MKFECQAQNLITENILLYIESTYKYIRQIAEIKPSFV